MCESCDLGRFDRRSFLAAGGAAAAGAAWLTSVQAGEGAASEPRLEKRAKSPARLRAVFLYPPADVVNAGQMEDSWRVHNWFTWPGNQFEPEKQEKKFTEKILPMAKELGVEIDFAPRAIYQQAKVEQFIQESKSGNYDAVLVVNFWNTLSKASFQIATEAAPTAIVYHALGSNHQLPPESLRKTAGFYYIHSVENWSEIERGLRAVRAKKELAQSRMLRVTGRVNALTRGEEKDLGVDLVTIPADELNGLFDAVERDHGLIREAMEFKKHAARVMDVTDEYFIDAFRAHRAVGQVLARYGADAITIECLFLKHRKPCVSFAIHNGQLVPCGCENHLDATLTLMLGRWLFDRPGFQHNPEFDTSENRYFGSHCTCSWKMQGPAGPSQEYLVRPFFHHLPKTAALDVQWTPGQSVVLAKYLSGQSKLACWTGKVIHSPTSPPVGGCATRVLVELDGVPDVCSAYAGPHPVLFCGDRGDARRIKAFARMYKLTLAGNVS